MGLLDSLVNKRARAPADAAARAAVLLDRVDEGVEGGSNDKVLDEVGRLLASMKITLFGDGDAAPSREAALALAADACAAGLPSKLVAKLGMLDFETRKYAATVLGAIFRIDVDGATPGADYLVDHPDVVGELLEGYDYPSIALNCGAILRDACRDSRTVASLLADDAAVRRLLAAVDAASFEVASDAFATLRDVLTRHKAVVAARLNASPPASDLWGVFAPLLASGNYVTRRQSARLLGELLLERANAAAMLRYVADPDHLKAAMVLLKDGSRAISFEAFHLIKVFIANPNRAPPVVAILASNRDKLIKLLSDFQSDRDDEQFREEKAVVLRELAALGGGD